MKINNEKGFEITTLVMVVAAVGLLGFVAASVARRAYQTAQRQQIASAPDTTEHMSSPVSAVSTAPVLKPVNSTDFDLLVKSSATALEAANTSEHTTLGNTVNTERLQSIMIKQADSSVKIYVGRLNELSPGKWQLLTAFELVTYSNGEKGFLGVSEIPADRHIEFDSQIVVAWTNLPETHEYAEALRNFEQSGLE